MTQDDLDKIMACERITELKRLRDELNTPKGAWEAQTMTETKTINDIGSNAVLGAAIAVPLTLAMIVPWIMGIVLAKGFWATAAAITVPPYAWYLVAERLMQMAGMISA